MRSNGPTKYINYWSKNWESEPEGRRDEFAR